MGRPQTFRTFGLDFDFISFAESHCSLYVLMHSGHHGFAEPVN